MATATQTSTKASTKSHAEIADFFGKMYSFNNSLKLFHWHVTSKGSYAQHMALDQALEALGDVLDRIVETTYAMKGDLNIMIPSTKVPKDIVKHASDFFQYVDFQRELLPDAFSQAILDDCQEAIQQLLYKLKRLQ